MGIETGSASIEEITQIFQAMSDNAILGGCRVIGQIIELGTDLIPDWALPCDGSIYANVDYPDLAAVISAGLVVDADHFRTPDRYNRIGMGGPPTGTQGGEATHVLTTTEMPAHTHTEEGVGVELSAVLGTLEGFSAAPETNDTGSTGGGAGHNNIQPYEGTVFVIVAMSND